MATEEKSGLENLAQALGVRPPGLALVLPLIFMTGGMALAVLFPRYVDPFVPGGAPVVQIGLVVVWFGLMYFGFLKNTWYYREKFGDGAYRRLVLRFFLPGGMLMFGGILRPFFAQGPMAVGGLQTALWAFGVCLLALGLLLEAKGVKALGIDRITFVYTVFPERGRQVHWSVYRFLRHPLYTAMCCMTLGAACFGGTWAGFLCAAVFLAKIWVWSKAEEKELIGRFGESYIAYQRNVPAFVPKLKQFGGLLQELF